MSETDKNIHFRLSEERNRLGMSQDDVADLCGVTSKTISRWENGSPIPSDKLSVLMDKQFDVAYIFTGSKTVVPTFVETIDNEIAVSEPSNPGYGQPAYLSLPELSKAGENWWKVVASLSQQQREAVLTLVFNAKIAEFMLSNMDEDSIKVPSNGLEAFSNK